MATKKYLYQQADGQWIFGPGANDICPAGIYRVEITGNYISIRQINNREIADQYNTLYSDYLKANGAAYASIGEFITATKDFFTDVDTSVKNAIDELKAKQFAEGGIHILSGTNAAPAGNYTGFVVLAPDTTISALSGINTGKVSGNTTFNGISLQPGFIEIPGGFTGITLSAGSMILIKA